MDPRTRELAKMVVNYALSVKSGQNVMIAGSTEDEPFIVELYKEVLLKGGHPHLKVDIPGLAPFFFKHAKKHQIEKFPELLEHNVKKMDKYVRVSTESNTRELTSCDPKKMSKRKLITRSISEYISGNPEKIKWSLVAYPCQALAQDAEMSLSEYENFVYGACLQDWKKVGKQMNKVLAKFQKGKTVHLIGDGVDLKFDIHGDKAKTDLDANNIPMGEVFMAPVRESMNGWIKFDYPAVRDGKEVTDVELKFENGKVTEAKASKNEDFLKAMIEIDENASYIGEFGIGMNPKINRFTNNLGFDEKMGGTIHLALGMAYKENGGGNDSALHWDIVKSMKKAKIVLDGKVVQENAKWKL